MSSQQLMHKCITKSLHVKVPVAPHLGFFLVWNPLKQASSVWLVQDTPGWDDFGTHGLICHPHLQQYQWWHHQLPTLDVASGPKPGMVIYGHPAGTGHQRTSERQTDPTPVCQDKSKFKNFDDFEGLTSFKRF